MKKLNIFLESDEFILDKTEHEKIREELTVDILSTIKKKYTSEKYRQDLEEAVMLFITEVCSYIFWKNTNDIELYNKLYNEFKDSFKQTNIPLTVRDDLDFTMKYLCHNFNVGILGQYDDLLIDALDDEDILKYFNFLESLDNYVYSKPDPRYFDAILNSANVKASDTIMIGNRIDTDIIPAKQIGIMKTIRFKSGIHKNQKPRYPIEFPDYELVDLNKLPDIIEEIIPVKW